MELFGRRDCGLVFKDHRSPENAFILVIAGIPVFVGDGACAMMA